MNNIHEWLNILNPYMYDTNTKVNDANNDIPHDIVVNNPPPIQNKLENRLLLPNIPQNKIKYNIIEEHKVQNLKKITGN
jgi:hypothetical protein